MPRDCEDVVVSMECEQIGPIRGLVIEFPDRVLRVDMLHSMTPEAESCTQRGVRQMAVNEVDSLPSHEVLQTENPTCAAPAPQGNDPHARCLQFTGYRVLQRDHVS